MPNDAVRVCFVIDRLSRAGTEMQLLLLLRHLDRRQVHPYLCLLDGGSEASRELEPDDVPVLRLGVRRLISLHAARQAWRFRRFLKENRIDVVQAYFTDSTRFAAPIAKATGVRAVFGSRRNIGHWTTRRDRLLGRFYNWLFFDKVIANCDAVRQSVIDQESVDADDVVVIRNGLDLARFARIHPWASKPAGSPRKVGMVGNLREVKGPDLFIEAAKIVLAQQPNTWFEIAGGGNREPYQQLIDRLGLQNHVRLLGPVSDIPAFLETLDLAVLPSRAEGLSNALLEYMAAGRPIVATDVGGNAELVQHLSNGLIAECDPSAIASAIQRILVNPQQAAEWAASGRESLVSSSNGDAVAALHTSFYRQAVGSHS